MELELIKKLVFRPKKQKIAPTCFSLVFFINTFVYFKCNFQIVNRKGKL